MFCPIAWSGLAQMAMPAGRSCSVTHLPWLPWRTRYAASSAGDLLALEQDFSIELRGNEQLWTVRMQPRGAAAARALDSLELQGAGGRLQVIVILEREGERTTTRFDP